MNTTAWRGLWGLAIASALLAVEMPAAQSQAGAIATTLVTNAGTLTGLTIPYQVFASYSTLDASIPIGTALVAIPESTGR